ncbi:hypothetical protein TH53_13895 [Pedobacter lusitanus]|uniref:Uncharacterized protein n=1 Tax=Pedobacter lusitanus TaxID=1503925 RepID=A0A0D0GQ19_9SPHI|nr:hypothetical protein [Pedobacter lusitanus]KIO76636.1 hypothetical protein TH53_13895 [Pedobacter lusitanus]
MKRYILFFLLFISVSGYAQNTINNYKYVIVPERFSFLKEDDQYRLNTLAKFLLQDKGFTAYFDNGDLPNEIANNKCNALHVEVLSKNSMFTTNLTMLLKDCKGNIIFKSKEGKSREKEFKTSYNMALRDAFTSLNDVPYAYTGTAAVQNQETAAAATVAAPVSAAVIVPATEVVTAKAAVVAPVTAPVVKVVAAETSQPAGTLYAQPTANGYQLIDTTPKKVLTLSRTSVQDYFIADNGNANGIVLKKNGEWFFEYYKDGKLMGEKLLIKF